MSVLVTGGAGFIGSHLVDALLAQGRSVVVVDNFDPFYPRGIKEANLRGALSHPNFRLIEGDIRDRELLDGLPEISQVAHLAALAGVRPSIERAPDYIDVNVNGTAQVLDFARRREIREFVFASSSSVYGNTDEVPFREEQFVGAPISPYAASKRAAELTCHAYHHLHEMAVVCLRLFTVYGPRQRPDLAIHKFADRMSRGEAIPMFGDGSTERDYTYVDDIVLGIQAGLDYVAATPGAWQIANLGEATTISLSRMIEVLGSSMGVQPLIEKLPAQPGDVERTFANVERAGELFGYAPGVEFEAGIGRFVEWFRGLDRGASDA